MSTEKFTITEHLVPGSHIREYPGSTVNQEDVLKIHVKQYTPKREGPVPDDAITFIATHGVGLPKELYEPLWDELLDQASGFHIRAIWMADVASMNQSGIHNEDKLSMDCSWMDHARDLLLMINHFRDQMPRPLVGIGHAFGGNIITNLAYLHPRLFTTLLLLDPLIQLSPPSLGFGTDAPSAINYTLWRDDVWPSREVAIRANRAIMQGMDPRCLDRMTKHFFRDLPTPLYPDVEAIKALFGTTADSTTTPVTLTTPKYHELVAQIRQNFNARDPKTGRIEVPRDTHADMDPLVAYIPLYRPEPRSTFRRLETLRPSCLWVIAGATFLNIDEIREGVKICGSGIGGSGGVPDGRVREVVLPGFGHLMPFQEVKTVAETCIVWLQQEMDRFRQTERQWKEDRDGKSHLAVEENWYKVLKPIPSGRKKRNDKGKL
uniref:acyl-CoA hydrolase MpaH' n=1 Tax=Penicillium brevicompactum TaxID=5074 RepID=UPI001B3C186D|nr:Chain A, acyl-CoA hydrolase MpaH' [Penicillium brevicompactum]7DBL_B Chain B, acyl-CoA hydrolase MpaH' [Penicillium brevicompactum]7DBL_C Chain C, acyl-CoA hydrolase MpaH' [Penicillium brevicompactum]7DBL_D Chain D, acyl-CoA hydrolase MpaH' [Penicillium brevicompactum]